MPIRIWVGSWNVGNSPPGNLALWLPSVGADYDLVVVGAQVPRSSSSIVSLNLTISEGMYVQEPSRAEQFGRLV